MKKLTTMFFALIGILITCCTVSAQTGKPQFNLRCEREGTFIGNIRVELFPLIAPLHVNNFDSLVNIQFYDTTAFHRVVPNFVIQGGDPNSRHGDPSTWGNGDPSQTNVPAEFSAVNHARGILGAARDNNINSANSQFFINVVENSGLNGRYTAYGRVYEGMDVADNIVNSPTFPGTERPVQKIEMFVTNVGMNQNIPQIPSLIYPPDNLTDVINSMNFQWSGDNETVLFRLQISRDSTFTNNEIDEFLGVKTSLRGNFTQGLVKYFWRVQANNGGNLSNFSETRSFTTGINAPTLTSPPDSAVNVPVSPLFEWQPVNGALSYRIQIATSGAFVGPALVINESGLTSTTFTATNLQTNKKYFWRVRGITANYEATYSNVRTFTTTAAVSVNDDDPVLDFSLQQNYPNPFNPSTRITFSLMKSEYTTLKIFDIQGREVATLVNDEMPAGIHAIEFSAGDFNSSLTSGIYFYTLRTETFSDTKKMLYLK